MGTDQHTARSQWTLLYLAFSNVSTRVRDFRRITGLIVDTTNMLSLRVFPFIYTPSAYAAQYTKPRHYRILDF